MLYTLPETQGVALLASSGAVSTAAASAAVIADDAGSDTLTINTDTAAASAAVIADGAGSDTLNLNITSSVGAEEDNFNID